MGRCSLHTHTLCNGSNTTTLEANRALHGTASARQASKNNECDIVMWLGAFLQCKAKRGAVGDSEPTPRPVLLSDRDTGAPLEVKRSLYQSH